MSVNTTGQKAQGVGRHIRSVGTTGQLGVGGCSRSVASRNKLGRSTTGLHCTLSHQPHDNRKRAADTPTAPQPQLSVPVGCQCRWVAEAMVVRRLFNSQDDLQCIAAVGSESEVWVE